jgi:hypothetical protein
MSQTIREIDTTVLRRELNYVMTPKQVILYKARNFACNDRVAELSLEGP